jgi:hypothetical protein
MPKAGVEPARGEAPLDFESSASSSSATSARSILRHRIGVGLLDVLRPVIISRQHRSDQPGVYDGARSQSQAVLARRSAI